MVKIFALFDAAGLPVGFYPSDIHQKPPEGSIEITEEQYEALQERPYGALIYRDGAVVESGIVPTPLTNVQRIDAVFPQTDSARVIFETFFNVANRLQALEGKQPITRAQLLDWMKTIF